MPPQPWLTEQFEASRGHLRAVAYRMLGSLGEAEDAVQEAWLRLNRSDMSEVENVTGWLTTVVARVCLDTLRARKSRREEELDEQISATGPKSNIDPEREALLAESVGLALLVVMERLTPAERLAFVLHDMFAISFEDIAEILGRTPMATRQLASRARRRVQGVDVASKTALSQQRVVVEAFLSALRAGDVQGILAVLDPDIVRRADPGAAAAAPRVIYGAAAVTEEALKNVARAQIAQIVLIDGAIGVIVAPQGKLRIALRCQVEGEKIVEFEVIGAPERLSQLDIVLLPA